MNPFDDTIDKDILFNISTVKAASTEVTDLQLNVKTAGYQQKLNFILECSSTPARFDKLIKRNKIFNFASQCMTLIIYQYKEITFSDLYSEIVPESC